MKDLLILLLCLPGIPTLFILNFLRPYWLKDEPGWIVGCIVPVFSLVVSMLLLAGLIIDITISGCMKHVYKIDETFTFDNETFPLNYKCIFCDNKRRHI